MLRSCFSFWLGLSLYVNAWGLGAAESSRPLFFAHSGQISPALQAYYSHKATLGRHDFVLLQRLALTTLKWQWRQSALEYKLMALIGAGIALDDQARNILEEGILSSYPQVQLIALHMLTHYSDDEVEWAMLSALRSEYMLIRCEAAVCLAQKQHARATAHIDALYQRVPTELHPLFPALYAASGDKAAVLALRRLLTHPQGAVRTAAIAALAHLQRDDMLPILRQLALQGDIAQQEAAVAALGSLKDSLSLDRLRQLSLVKDSSVALAALLARYELGEHGVAKTICQVAQKGNLFAIAALAQLPEGKETLANLVSSSDAAVSLNASVALLTHSDARCLAGVKRMLLLGRQNTIYTRWATPGGSLKIWKVASAYPDPSQMALDEEASLALREKLLVQVALLEENDFLNTMEQIFDQQQNDLIPTAAALLEQSHSEQALAVLRKKQQQLGAPLVRLWAALALYRSTRDPQAAYTLSEWIKSHCHEELISFRTLIPMVLRTGDSCCSSPHQLTAKEQCRLLIEALEAFAMARDEQGVDLLLYALEHSPAQNRAILAGLLLRATQ